MIDIRVTRSDDTIPLPFYASSGAAGMDLCSTIELVLPPGQRALVPTGISVAIPEGWELQIRPRSGLAWKNGITILNSPGTIDSDYRGMIQIILFNSCVTDFNIKRGDRIAQAVLAVVHRISWCEVKELDDTVRGLGGFGSTGLSSIL